MGGGGTLVSIIKTGPLIRGRAKLAIGGWWN
jgi:hypothetical protein